MSTDNESKTPARTHERPHFMTQAWLAEQAKTSLLALEVVHLDAEIAKLREENKQQAENLASSKENGDAEGVSEGVSAGGCKAAGAEVCGRCGATSAKDAEAKCRPEGDSCPGVGLWWRQAAGACPECDGSGTVEKCDWPGEHANRYLEPCPKGCKWRKAAGAAAPVEFATTSTPGAFAFLANEPDVYATPAADARQPEDETPFWMNEEWIASTASALNGTAREMAREIQRGRVRLAASEKAKAELLDRIGSASTWINWASADLRRATEAAAERAGGAS